MTIHPQQNSFLVFMKFQKAYSAKQLSDQRTDLIQYLIVHKPRNSPISIIQYPINAKIRLKHPPVVSTSHSNQLFGRFSFYQYLFKASNLKLVDCNIRLMPMPSTVNIQSMTCFIVFDVLRLVKQCR